MFLSPPSNFTLRVQENETIGAEVVRVHAIDTDIGKIKRFVFYFSNGFKLIHTCRFYIYIIFPVIGSNGAVRYRIRKDPLGNYRTFKIDPVSGIISLAQGLDRERQKVISFEIYMNQTKCNNFLSRLKMILSINILLSKF